MIECVVGVCVLNYGLTKASLWDDVYKTKRSLVTNQNDYHMKWWFPLSLSLWSLTKYTLCCRGALYTNNDNVAHICDANVAIVKHV